MLLPVTTVLSVIVAGFSIAHRCSKAAMKSCLPEVPAEFFAVIFALPLVPLTVAFALLLPLLWAAAIQFSLYALSPAFYFNLEAAFTWAVEGTPAFRFDRQWQKEDRRRAPKVVVLFHPGITNDEQIPEGITANSVAFLITFSLLVDFVVGAAAVGMDVAHAESGATWDGAYVQASFAWLCVTFLYNSYIVVQMLKSGSLFNPDFFLGSNDAESNTTGVLGMSNPMFENTFVVENPLFDEPGTADGASYLMVAASGEKAAPQQMPLCDIPDWLVGDVGESVKVSLQRHPCQIYHDDFL